jgi:3-oxoacyl-[acyl-carrier protein] reductase
LLSEEELCLLYQSHNPLRHNRKKITVNAVDPGATDTGWMSYEIRSQLDVRAPFGRVGIPEDAARIVLFLASEQGQWITGQIIRSRGGQ